MAGAEQNTPSQPEQNKARHHGRSGTKHIIMAGVEQNTPSRPEQNKARHLDRNGTKHVILAGAEQSTSSWPEQNKARHLDRSAAQWRDPCISLFAPAKVYSVHQIDHQLEQLLDKLEAATPTICIQLCQHPTGE